MTEETGSALEHLDQLIEEGKITRAEYETLRAALEAPPRPAAPVPPVALPPLPVEPPPPRRLCKSWRHRLLGGVCGGIADYWGLNPWNVRLLFIIGSSMTGGGAFLVYLILCFVLPWSEDKVPMEDSIESIASRRPFAVNLAWGILFNALLLHVIIASRLDQLSLLGRPSPLPTLLAAHLARPLVHTGWGWLFLLMFYGASVLIYKVLPQGRPRMTCRYLYFYGFLTLFIFLLVAIIYPVVMVPRLIH